MRVLLWVVEGTWPGAVDAAAELLGGRDAEVTLLHAAPGEVTAAAEGAVAGLLGRGRRGREPGERMAAAAQAAAGDLLAAAAERLGRPAELVARTGRVERIVVEAAAGADLLVVARDGDRSRLGPRSLGPATRFVVDHAPCQVVLVWPEAVPGLESMPPPPPGHGPPPSGHGPPPPPHER